ncbi:MAG: signal recognition particle-docking protein FtsY [Firmicutes bacterium]|nr:signal recognition particle-docking protein FtsY [Bacillota bacterium]
MDKFCKETENSCDSYNKDKKQSIYQKLKHGLSKTREDLSKKINSIFGSFKALDDEMIDELEEILITSDIGVETSIQIIEKIKDRVKKENITDLSKITEILKEEIISIIGEKVNTLENSFPKIIVMIGVNGVGKTTSIGKIAYKYKEQGKKVIVVAADTFRAAAIEQLEVWSRRINVDLIKHQEGGDPAAVIYDAIQSAKSKKADVVICDTAGRLHNKKNLMEELKKIFKVINREYPEAFQEILLVLDATTGQNSIAQARAFKEIADINGIVLTKLDGTAKGGIVIAIKEELNLPVKLIGVGENIDDLQDFEPKDFVNALFIE